MKKLNIGLIGYRFMGKAHSNAWRQVSRFFDTPFAPVMKVICGRNQQAVKKAAHDYGWEQYSTSWEEVGGRKDIDVIDICTPAVALAKQIIEERQIGQIYHYRGTYLQDWLVSPDFPRVWRLEKAKAGSGVLGDLVSHSVDLARYLVGEITEVSGLLKTFITERPVEKGSRTMAPVDVDDAALSLVRFENGAAGTIEGTRFATGRKNHNRFEINGSKGSLVFDLERMNELELYIEEGPNSGFRKILVTDSAHPYVSGWWPRGHIIGYEHTFTHTVLDLLKAIGEQQIPSPNFEDGVRNQRVLDAIERAAGSQRWERV